MGSLRSVGIRERNKIGSQRIPAKYMTMNEMKQHQCAERAVRALSQARLSSYRRFFDATDDHAAYGLYCWNDAISASLSYALAHTEIALRNQFHVALSARYGVGVQGSRNWYECLALNQKSRDAIRKITHEVRRTGGSRQLVPRVPPPSPDDVVSKLTFGFWSHLLDISADLTSQAINWPGILVDALPGHRNASVEFWTKLRNRDALFARIDFCKDLRNRIAHLEPIWKAGPLMIERRARARIEVTHTQPAPSTPDEALSRLQLAYDRTLQLLGWLSPDLLNIFHASEAHHRFKRLNQLSTLDAYRRHGGRRRTRPIELNAHRSLRKLKRELRRISKRHATAEVLHNSKPIAWWQSVE